MADLFKHYLSQKAARVAELSEEWETTIKEFIYNQGLPDFAKAGQNRLYDFNNRNSRETLCT